MSVIMNEAPVNNGRYGRYNGRWIRIVYPFKMTTTAIANPTAQTQKIIIGCNNAVSLRIVGGHFVESDLADTQIAVKNLTAGEHTLYVSNTASTIDLYNPGAVTKLDFGNDTINYVGKMHFAFPLESLVDMTALATVNFAGVGVTGDIGNLKYLTNLTSLNLYNCTALTGALSNLSRLTNLTSLSLTSNSKYTGALSDLSNMSNLVTLDLRGSSSSVKTKFTGTASEMNTYAPGLKTFSYTNSAITGTWTSIAA